MKVELLGGEAWNPPIFHESIHSVLMADSEY